MRLITPKILIISGPPQKKNVIPCSMKNILLPFLIKIIERYSGLGDMFNTRTERYSGCI